MNEDYKEIFVRNWAFFSEVEQEKLRRSSIGIAGMGGVGGLLAERLVRIGIENLKITDNGTFEKSNLNRQFGSSMRTTGRSKAEVVFEQIKDINRQARIQFTNSGLIDKNDADMFVGGCDVVIDEMDTGAFKQSILLQRASREKGIPYLFTTAIGFGAVAVVFPPGGMTIEEYNGITPDENLDVLSNMVIPLQKMVPVMPSYVSKIPADVGEKIAAGTVPVPTTSIGAGLASILGAMEAINIILKNRNVVAAPQYRYLDLFDTVYNIGTID